MQRIFSENNRIKLRIFNRYLETPKIFGNLTILNKQWVKKEKSREIF